MTKTILIGGFGPGISTAVAETFAAHGFALALVARNEARLSEAAKAFQSRGHRAEAFAADLSDPAAAKAVVAQVRQKMGPLTVLHWNAYTPAAGDLLTADVAALRAIFDVPLTSLVAAVQEALPDLRARKEGAVLVTNGGLGLFDPAIDAMAVGWNAMGLAVGNAAKHKAAGLLHAKLKPEGVFVGEVVVLGTVKGTAWDSGTATLEASRVATAFWNLYRERTAPTTQVG